MSDPLSHCSGQPSLSVKNYTSALTLFARYRGRLILLLLGYYALAILAFLSFRSRDVFFHHPQVDEFSNLEGANHLLSGQINAQLFNWEPGTYVYFALLNKLGIQSPQGIKAFQLFGLNALNILLVFLLASRIRPQWAFPAALIYAFNPLAIFMALTLMKTTICITMFTLCLYCFFRFLNEPGRWAWGIMFGIFWALSWWINQMILILLIPMFYFLYRRHSHLEPTRLLRSKHCIIGILGLILLLIIISLGTATWIVGQPMFTLSINGPINFYIANNPDYRRTMTIWPGPAWDHLAYQFINGKLDHLGMIKHKPLAWLELMTRKSYWNFTPYLLFRQFYWGYYEEIFPYFKIGILFNLFLIVFSLTALFFWRRLTNDEKALAGSWLAFQVINIFFMPGIARYLAPVSALTIPLALTGLAHIKKIRRAVLPLCLAVFLIFSKPPNEFKREYTDFLKAKLSLEQGKTAEVIIPENTKRIDDWRYIEGLKLFKEKKYREALVIMRNVIQFTYYQGLSLLVDIFYRLDLYYEGWKLLEKMSMSEPGDADRKKYLFSQSVFNIERMLEAYRREGFLVPAKAYELALFLFELRKSTDPGVRQRLPVLLRTAADLISQILPEIPAQDRARIVSLLEDIHRASI